MRLDKFLKVSRLIKRRTVANEACDAGRVLVNGTVAKAAAVPLAQAGTGGQGVGESKSRRRDRDPFRDKDREGGGAGYPGDHQKRRGERIVPVSVIKKNNLS